MKEKSTTSSYSQRERKKWGKKAAWLAGKARYGEIHMGEQQILSLSIEASPVEIVETEICLACGADFDSIRRTAPALPQYCDGCRNEILRAL